LESRDRRVISLQRLREIVLRDLGWLMNTGGLGTVQDLDAYPDVSRSVVNYGLPDLTGVAVSALDPEAAEKAVADAILAYEPRILAHSLRVRADVQRGQMNPSALTFRIEGELWAQPAPIALYMRTELDLETGQAQVSEMRR
jgi:type VI secretion system protein ImpF